MRKFMLACGVLLCFDAFCQDAIEYKLPPKAIADLATAALTPAVSFDSRGSNMLILERSSMPSVEDLAQPELRIAGLRINPKTFGPSRNSYYTSISIRAIKDGSPRRVTGVPENLKAGNISWSADDKKFAFTNTSSDGIDLYVADVSSGRAAKVNGKFINMAAGAGAFSWMSDNSLVYLENIHSSTEAPVKILTPKGPTVQQNLGKTAAAVTYQDLIRSYYDEQLFEFYATAQLVRNKNGVVSKIGSPSIYQRVELSPDEQYILLERTDKPFSYLVPAGGFNSTVLLIDLSGKMIKELAKIPSNELLPAGYDNVLNAPRNIQWLDYRAATLCWIEPLDSGLIKSKTEFHDALYSLAAPFKNAPVLETKIPGRASGFSDIDGDKLLVYEISRVKHHTKMNLLNTQSKSYSLLFERSTDDAYSDIGAPLSDKNAFNRDAIKLKDGRYLFMRSIGSTPAGDKPFLAKFDITTKENQILWRSADPYYETISAVLDFEKLLFITNKQSQTDQPNYFLHDLSLNVANKITNFPDPQPSLRGVTKQKITYKRNDGVDLAADLYLPSGYDMAKNGRLPVFIWAYPREFKSGSDAAQVRGTANTFVRVSNSSAIFWVTQGFAVMDNTEFPIVGEGTKQPNDNFISQLTENAKAAIDKIVEMGIGDRDRVAVGGHSYGAFMTANLLAHTNFFKAGIARSGAYNRTLTPFGFQNEERTYWQAPEVYNAMSPFANADKIKTPILLIHGEADNNSGTFPIQSERLYNAIKGNGGTVRYVQLPYEAHGYTARENILHMLWEMNEWLEKYVKK